MTIKDIAKESGFALGTVSRVLNNHPDVSDKTREKIMAVVKKHGFVLNVNAKQLKAQDRKTVIIIVKGTSNILLNSLLERLLKKIEVSPYNATTVFIDEYDNEAQKAKVLFYEQKPVGFIFLGGSPDRNQDDFSVIEVPCVIISNQADNIQNEKISSVAIDDYKASSNIAEYLIKKGHKKIGIIGGELIHTQLSDRRYQGFVKAITNANIEFDENKSFVASKYSMEGGAAATRILMTQYPDLTAILTMSDSLAIGVIRQLGDMGLKVPEDISVTGFDGLSIADYTIPRLATVKQLADELVENGFNALLNSIERKSQCVHITVPFELIEGESVKDIN